MDSDARMENVDLGSDDTGCESKAQSAQQDPAPVAGNDDIIQQEVTVDPTNDAEGEPGSAFSWDSDSSSNYEAVGDEQRLLSSGEIDTTQEDVTKDYVDELDEHPQTSAETPAPDCSEPPLTDAPLFSPRTAERIQFEEARGYYYDEKPSCPKEWLNVDRDAIGLLEPYGWEPFRNYKQWARTPHGQGGRRRGHPDLPPVSPLLEHGPAASSPLNTDGYISDSPIDQLCSPVYDTNVDEYHNSEGNDDLSERPQEPFLRPNTPLPLENNNIPANESTPSHSALSFEALRALGAGSSAFDEDADDDFRAILNNQSFTNNANVEDEAASTSSHEWSSEDEGQSHSPVEQMPTVQPAEAETDSRADEELGSLPLQEETVQQREAELDASTDDLIDLSSNNADVHQPSSEDGTATQDAAPQSPDSDQALEEITAMDRDEAAASYREYRSRMSLSGTKAEAAEALKKNRALQDFCNEALAKSRKRRDRPPESYIQLPVDADERTELSRIMAHYYKQEADRMEAERNQSRAEREYAHDEWRRAALEASRLRDDYENLLGERDETWQELQDHRDALTAKRDAIDKMKQELSDLEDKLKKCCQCPNGSEVADSGDIEDLLKDVDGSHCENCKKLKLAVEEQKAIVEALGADWGKEQDKTDKQKTIIKTQKKIIATNERTIADLERQLDEFIEGRGPSDSTFEKAYDLLEEEHKWTEHMHQAELKELEERLRKTTEERDKAVTRLDKLQRQLDDEHQSANPTCEQKCESLRGELAEAEKRYKAEQSKIETMRERFRKTNAKLTDALDRIEELEGSLEADSDEEDNKQVNTVCVEKCKSLEDELAKNEKARKELEDAHRDQKNQIENLQNTANSEAADGELQARIDELQANYHELQAEHARLEDQYRALSAKSSIGHGRNRGRPLVWNISPQHRDELVDLMMRWIRATDREERRGPNENEIDHEQVQRMLGDNPISFDAFYTALREAGYLVRHDRLAQELERWHTALSLNVPLAITFAAQNLGPDMDSIERLLGQISELRLDLRGLQDERHQLQYQVDQIGQNLVGDSNEVMELLKVQLAAAHGELQEANLRAARVRTQLQKAREQNKDINERALESQSLLNGAFEDNDRLHEQIQALNTRLNNLHKGHAGSRSPETRPEQDQDVSDLQANIDRLYQLFKSREQDARHAEEEPQDLRNAIEQLHQQIDEHVCTLAQHQQESDAAMNERNGEIARLTADLAEYEDFQTPATSFEPAVPDSTIGDAAGEDESPISPRTRAQPGSPSSSGSSSSSGSFSSHGMPSPTGSHSSSSPSPSSSSPSRSPPLHGLGMSASPPQSGACPLTHRHAELERRKQDIRDSPDSPAYQRALAEFQRNREQTIANLRNTAAYQRTARDLRIQRDLEKARDESHDELIYAAIKKLRGGGVFRYREKEERVAFYRSCIEV